MSELKTKEENPKGLYGKYYIQKITGHKIVGHSFFGEPQFEAELEEVSEDAKYFVLRYDDHQKDKNHRKACLEALKTYAICIRPFIPELADNLDEILKQ